MTQDLTRLFKWQHLEHEIQMLNVALERSTKQAITKSLQK